MATPSTPKRHHFVPKVYLRAWANDLEQVSVRRRTSRSAYTANINDVAVELDLNGVGDEAAAREKMYEHLESDWPQLRDALISGVSLEGTGRTRAALFVALQKTRTREARDQQEFFNHAATKIPKRPFAFAAVKGFLTNENLGFELLDGEVNGCMDFLNYVSTLSGKHPGRFLQMLAPGLATQELAPVLESLNWQVEECRKPILYTSDSPVIAWRTQSERDEYEGVGIATAEEIWFPLTPRHLLVMTRTFANMPCKQVEPKRFVQVNEEIASRCYEFLVATHGRLERLNELTLRSKKPLLRFYRGKGVEWDHLGVGHFTGDEVLHVWAPARDDASGTQTFRRPVG
jgi:hypothetical protein